MYVTSLFLALLPAIHALPRSSLENGQESGRLASFEELRKSEELAAPSAVLQLKGKFLHITDIHPDPFYKVYSSTDDESACHRHKGPAGYYGAETSDCDSPVALVNATFKWLKEHMRNEIDFIVWTGDSARHDNDEQIPRSTDQVVSQNKLIVTKFLEAFGKPENWDNDDPLNDFIVPIVPTLGNNDILPHNIFEEGPNIWTSRYLNIWRQFIPEHQRHQFQRGGWFSVEVIPGKLQVFSLNTLYFFASNSAVDGCASKNEPGYEQFEWLRIQLDQVRARGMKALIIGHVPPARVEAKMSWVETCWQKYALWMRQYRDVLVGGLYGHMNIDHFFLQDWEDVKGHVRKGKEYDSDEEGVSVAYEEEFTTQSLTDYLVNLRDMFAKIPLEIVSDELESSEKKHKKLDFDDIGGEFGERYSVSMVGPSLIPNFFPTVRVYSYNISGLENLELPSASSFHRPSHENLQSPISVQGADSETPKLELRSLDSDYLDDADDYNAESHDDVVDNGKKKHKKKKHHKKKKKGHKFEVPKGPSKTAPPGPAYSPQSLTLLSFTQYFANLTYINNDYLEADQIDIGKWKPGKHHGKTRPKKKKPTPHNLTFEVEYNTAEDKIYNLPDLTVRSWLDLASSIANSKRGGKSMASTTEDGMIEPPTLHQDVAITKNRNKAWFAFVRRAFVGTIDEDEVEDQFGY